MRRARGARAEVKSLSAPQIWHAGCDLCPESSEMSKKLQYDGSFPGSREQLTPRSSHDQVFRTFSQNLGDLRGDQNLHIPERQGAQRSYPTRFHGPEYMHATNMGFRGRLPCVWHGSLPCCCAAAGTSHAQAPLNRISTRCLGPGPPKDDAM